MFVKTAVKKTFSGVSYGLQWGNEEKIHTSHTHETKNELKWYYFLVIMPDS